MTTQKNNLRTRLRKETGPAHEALDGFMAETSFDNLLQYRGFLRAHRRALSGFSTRIDGPLSDLPARMAATLERDLTALDVTWQPLPERIALNGLAVHYVLLGSRMGARVLNGRRARSAAAPVRAAGAYLSLEVPKGAWPVLCADLAARDGDDAFADKVVADACRLFDIFLTTARAEPALATPSPMESPAHVA